MSEHCQSCQGALSSAYEKERGVHLRCETPKVSGAARNVAPGREYPWTEETMQRINVLTPKIKEKAFSLDWFLLRQRFEQIEDLARKDPASCETTATGEEIANFCFHDWGCPAGSADSVVRWRSGDEEKCACGLSVSLASAPTPGPRPETVTADLPWSKSEHITPDLLAKYAKRLADDSGTSILGMYIKHEECFRCAMCGFSFTHEGYYYDDIGEVCFMCGATLTMRGLIEFASRPPAAAERTK